MAIKVAVLMGSDSDLGIMENTFKALKEFKIRFDVKVLSAHRTPHQVVRYIKAAEKKGVKVFIAGAGGAAHLAGVVASHTVLPVIGVPIDATPLKGLDALLATCQMPPGVPVATVAVGKMGAYNAGLLAVQCLAIADRKLARALVQYKKTMVSTVVAKDKKVQKTIKK
ncbi:MAG: 5-(carboxyamino)imidazole ribonucleotide mutase [Candidatus Omnitrophica bacterium]|nr:5-(carboxyamino)imidazole ribonucleotide mutase [Candidatus Omnitrophota bacterium]